MTLFYRLYEKCQNDIQIILSIYTVNNQRAIINKSHINCKKRNNMIKRREGQNQMAEGVVNETHTGHQNKKQEPIKINRPGKSQNQEIKTHRTVPKDKVIIETQNVSTTPSVKGSSCGQSRGQLHVVATGLTIYFDNNSDFIVYSD